MAKKNKSKDTDTTIAVNRKARHEYEILQTVEAGVALQGWEVKSIRAGRATIADAYVQLKRGEAFLVGAQITPLQSASTHVIADPARFRKLLLHDYELRKWIGSVERSGNTLIPLKMYWKNNKVKLEVALAHGKKLHDKRRTIKEREWARDKQRIKKMIR